MQIHCDATDIIYPMLADIYYPTVEQSGYGNVTKTWMLDSTIACSFTTVGAKGKKDVLPNPSITLDSIIVGRSKRDPRISIRNSKNAITNIIITNVRDKYSNVVYKETSGPRAGLPTIFEIATNEPIMGPFGKVEYYKIVLRRSENQAVDV